MLRKLNDGRAVDHLLQALADEDSGVRLSTAKVLGKVNDARAAEPLLQALADNNSDARSSAAEALRKVGRPLTTHARESLVSTPGRRREPQHTPRLSRPGRRRSAHRPRLQSTGC